MANWAWLEWLLLQILILVSFACVWSFISTKLLKQRFVRLKSEFKRIAAELTITIQGEQIENDNAVSSQLSLTQVQDRAEKPGWPLDELVIDQSQNNNAFCYVGNNGQSVVEQIPQSFLGHANDQQLKILSNIIDDQKIKMKLLQNEIDQFQAQSINANVKDLGQVLVPRSISAKDCALVNAWIMAEQSLVDTEQQLLHCIQAVQHSKIKT